MDILQSLRAWKKNRRRIRENIKRIQYADVIFVSHAKSGRTWVRVMLSHLYHQKFQTPIDEIIGFDNFNRINEQIPKIFFSHATHEPDFVRKKILQVGSRKRAFVLLVRDPRDVTVSLYFQYAHRARPEKLQEFGIPETIGSMAMFDFVCDDRLGLPEVIRYLNQWIRYIDPLPNHLLIRYEDISARPVDELTRLMEFLGGGFTQAQIAAAVDFAAYESLKKLEEDGFFRSDILQPAKAGDPDSFKVRRGKVGGYRDYFTAEQVAAIDRIVSNELDPRLGYGGNSGEVSTATLPEDVPSEALACR